jgi:hypothetical protein
VRGTVSPEDFCPVDPSGIRLDAAERPELSRGTVDFAVDGEEYWAPAPASRLLPETSLADALAAASLAAPASGASTAAPGAGAPRAPRPMDFVFALDLSLAGVRSGFVRAACESLRDALFGPEPCFPRASRVALMTFDAAVHFYDLSVRAAGGGASRALMEITAGSRAPAYARRARRRGRVRPGAGRALRAPGRGTVHAAWLSRLAAC